MGRYLKDGITQHDFSMLFEYLLKSEIQYHVHEYFIEMGRQVTELLSYIIHWLKLYFSRKISIFSQYSKWVFWRFLFPEFNAFHCVSVTVRIRGPSMAIQIVRYKI